MKSLAFSRSLAKSLHECRIRKSHHYLQEIRLLKKIRMKVCQALLFYLLDVYTGCFNKMYPI